MGNLTAPCSPSCSSRRKASRSTAAGRRTGPTTPSCTASTSPGTRARPESSSVRFPCDVCVSKPCTDVVVVGSAVAAVRRRASRPRRAGGGGSRCAAPCACSARVWYHGAFGMLSPSPRRSGPSPSAGSSPGAARTSDPRAPRRARNPSAAASSPTVGPRGTNPAPGGGPARLIRTHRTAPPPAWPRRGGGNFLPRRAFAGTADERWLRADAPPAGDFDDRFHQVARRASPPGRLRGGEPVLVVNIRRAGARSPSDSAPHLLRRHAPPRRAGGVAARARHRHAPAQRAARGDSRGGRCSLPATPARWTSSGARRRARVIAIALALRRRPLPPLLLCHTGAVNGLAFDPWRLWAFLRAEATAFAERPSAAPTARARRWATSGRSTRGRPASSASSPRAPPPWGAAELLVPRRRAPRRSSLPPAAHGRRRRAFRRQRPPSSANSGAGWRRRRRTPAA